MVWEVVGLHISIVIDDISTTISSEHFLFRPSALYRQATRQLEHSQSHAFLRHPSVRIFCSLNLIYATFFTKLSGKYDTRSILQATIGFPHRGPEPDNSIGPYSPRFNGIGLKLVSIGNVQAYMACDTPSRDDYYSIKSFETGAFSVLRPFCPPLRWYPQLGTAN